ncbi:uncharacterized protein LTR77_009921 [Saxophila tyrrhenica]|uniref:Uncharacterized protein n=1 Tax=Saxophila tyrrhenica TaxID=1690608 RepID=A0AAV9NZU3_9PEZI|nr:hypothetical protein LTR77_009921 [Saxophila tyrrhenica]
MSFKPTTAPGTAHPSPPVENMEGVTRHNLVELPAEVRNEIYGYVLADYPVQEFKTSNLTAHRVQGIQPALTQVNKQVRAETLPMFYANSELFIRIHSQCDVFGRNQAIIKVLEKLGPSLLSRFESIWFHTRLNRGFICRVTQRDGGTKLNSTLVVFFLSAADQARMQQQMQEARDFMAPAVDRDKQPKAPGLFGSVQHFRNLYVYLVRVAVRVEQSRGTPAPPATGSMLDTDGIEFLFDDRRVTREEVRLAVKYGVLE